MEKWMIDEEHSTIGFEVSYMMVSTVRGHFSSFSAEIKAKDLSNLTNANIYLEIDARSIDTFSNERDEHLKSEDFFYVDNYPKIYFQSTEIHKSKEKNTYKVIGNLTIKGITKEVTIDVIYGGKAIDPWGRSVYGFEAKTIINRENFGLLWNSVLEAGGILVGQEVTVKVDLELIKEDEFYLKPLSSKEESSEVENTKTFGNLTSDYHQMIAEYITDVVVITDQEGKIKYITPSLNKILGYDLSTFQNNNLFDYIKPKEVQAITEQIESYSKRIIKNSFTSEFRILHEKGYYVEVEADIIYTDTEDLIMFVIRDISEWKETEKVIFQLAFRDSLTKLPNKNLFMNKLHTVYIESKSNKTNFAILFIDIDDFKPINDQWSYDTGDEALKLAAGRIRSIIDAEHTLARVGGDEFALLLSDVPDEKYAAKMAEHILKQFEKPIKEVGEDFYIKASIGIALYPEHGDSPEQLINNANLALYQVKDSGKNNYIIFDKVMETQSLERSILENALRQGINKQQFYLEYQPKVNITTNEIIGMEALVRWNHPELGIIPPGKFIPLAEETGLIVPLGEWILRESCRQATEWQKSNFPPLILSVNISGRQFEDRGFIDKLKNVLNETGLNPEMLELEITESVLTNVKSTIEILKEIRKLGVLISVDDFGTGYSSLSYIKDLPIDAIKVDQSFVKDIHKNKESKEIARALINLANSIGIKAIAEGIEQKEHVEQLRKDGYKLGQGFYYSRPLKSDAFEQYVKNKQN